MSGTLNSAGHRDRCPDPDAAPAQLIPIPDRLIAIIREGGRVGVCVPQFRLVDDLAGDIIDRLIAIDLWPVYRRSDQLIRCGYGRVYFVIQPNEAIGLMLDAAWDPFLMDASDVRRAMKSEFTRVKKEDQGIWLT